MSQANFRAPRRKRKVYESYQSPFPVPLSHEDSYADDFKICQAEIINNSVVVTSPQDIELLYGKGYFGKGILSRSRPQYNIGDQQLAAKWRGSKMNLPIITSKKYQCHVEWAKGLLEEQGLSTYSVNKILEDYTGPHTPPSEKKDPDTNEPRTDMEHERIKCSESSDTRATGVPNNQNPSEDKVLLEENPIYDPLAKYGPDVLDTPDTVEEPDKEALEKMYCHKHDDFIVHCGCKPKKQILQTGSDSTGLQEPDHEYVWVQEEGCDTGLEGEDTKQETGVDRKEKLVCRRNPFKIFEHLQLSREEAFFLVYALGCLTVNYQKEPLTISKLWEVFSAVQPNFRTTYMAYHHFRSKGWVPKIGLKYGADLLLYRKGPPFYHASYSVIVEFVNENLEGFPLRPLTWKSLAGLNRTTVNVSKELLFCYLIKPSDFTERDMLSPECLKKIKVQELIVNRWIASRERMDPDEL